jgi:hypothetical protein
MYQAVNAYVASYLAGRNVLLMAADRAAPRALMQQRPDARIPAAADAQQGPEEQQYKLLRPPGAPAARAVMRARQDDLLWPGAAGAFAGQRQRLAQPLRPVPGPAPGLADDDHAHRRRPALHSARVLKVATCSVSSCMLRINSAGRAARWLRPQEPYPGLLPRMAVPNNREESVFIWLSLDLQCRAS